MVDFHRDLIDHKRDLQVMSGDTVSIVACVGWVLDIEAVFAWDSVAFDPPEELCALACEHRPDNQLKHALESWLEVGTSRQFLAQGQRPIQVEVVVLDILWQGFLELKRVRVFTKLFRRHTGVLFIFHCELRRDGLKSSREFWFELLISDSIDRSIVRRSIICRKFAISTLLWFKFGSRVSKWRRFRQLCLWP